VIFSEPLETLWQRRFGQDPPAGIPEAVVPFLRHRSVRKFLPEPIDPAVHEALIAAATSASTSSNLQLYSVVSVQDPERRARIAELCANQEQVKSCAWFVAWFADHQRLRHAAALVGEECNGLDYTEFMLMATIDVALAAERMACAAEALGLGVCYIGALRNNPPGVAELLKAPAGAVGLFGMCLGWPDPSASPAIKPRMSLDSIWHQEAFPDEASIGDYDARMTEFYQEQGMSSSASWSQKSGRRVDEHHLSGREVLREWLDKNQMGTR